MRLLFVSCLLFSSLIGKAKTKEDSIKLIKESLKFYDLAFTDAEIDSMLDGLNENKDVYFKMHKLFPANDLAYPFAFVPAPGLKVPSKKEKIAWDIPNRTELPANRNDLAFYSIPQLAALIVNKKNKLVATETGEYHYIKFAHKSLYIAAKPGAISIGINIFDGGNQS